jgi:hypothetical protein
MDNDQKHNICISVPSSQTVSNKLLTNPINHQRRIKFAEFEKIKEYI